MHLLDDLLLPIAGANPSGANLRYAQVYKEITEARRIDDIPLDGSPAKLADYAAVERLATEALAGQTKDLQIAAWLTEARLRRSGFDGLRQGIDLMRGLLEKFWDSVYPEIDEGDLEFRAAPLNWIGSTLDLSVKSVPLTKSGYNWFKYRESREVGYEADAQDDDTKLVARKAALAAKKISADQFDAAVANSPDEFYEELNRGLQGCDDSLAALDAVCQDKFGNAPPAFSGLRASLQETHDLLHILLANRPGEGAPVAEDVPAAEDGDASRDSPERAAAPPAGRSRALAWEPGSREEAIERLLVSVKYLRHDDPSNPVPYLLLRALRWGELRAPGQDPEALLEPPPNEVRLQLKRLAGSSDWEELLEAAEQAMSQPYGRGWLDLQRLAVQACAGLGDSYNAVAAAIRAELQAVVAGIPDLPRWNLLDDTPAANPETRRWLRDLTESSNGSQPVAGAFRANEPSENVDGAAPEAQPPDSFDLALKAACAGREEEALRMLAREMSQERCGRARFHRRVQIAQICLAAGHAAIACAILVELAAEIEERRLEQWEDPETLAHPLVLLFRCLGKLKRDREEKDRVYARICRLDPVQALELSS
ncbi:MAG TPA: type VI secretion system protein TssA [Bryobacteraceae bacterium]|nr:type VI secretion system protein TssA [Bryobacteraceae bacterium]